MKKLLAFAGSTSRKSINRQMVSHVAKLVSNVEIEILDLNDYELPLFSVDLEEKIGEAENAKKFLDKIRSADYLFISLAEHNGAYSAAFKNLLDWMSRIDGKVFAGKPMLLMATSPGGRGGSGVLEIAAKRFPFMGADIKGTFSLPEFNKHFQEGKGIVTPEHLAKLELAIEMMKIEA